MSCYSCGLQIPEEEKNLGPHDRLIHVYHFTKDTAQNQMVYNCIWSILRSAVCNIVKASDLVVCQMICNVFPFDLLWQQIQNFGEPFFLVIREGETLTEIKVRIQKKLQVPDDEFAKVFPLFVCSVVILCHLHFGLHFRLFCGSFIVHKYY